MKTCHKYIIAMRLTLEIRTSNGKPFYTVYNDCDSSLSDIIVSGWAILDTVREFVEEYNRLSMFDDDTPAYLRREDIELKRVRIFR